VEVSVQGRNTQGVRLIGIKGEEKLASIERVAETEADDDDQQNEES
jgi:hypothetical protein